MITIKTLSSFRTPARTTLLTLLAAAVCFAPVASTFAQSAIINHMPASWAPMGNALSITATIEGTSALPRQGRIYYQGKDAGAFAFSEMRIDRRQMLGEIPAGDVKGSEIAYYIWAELEGGAELTAPAAAPASGELYRVALKPATEKASGSAGVAILSPEPNSTLPDERGVVALAFLPGSGRPDPKSVKVYLDGKDLTSLAQITEDILVLALPIVRPGSHQISVKLEKDGQSTELMSWGFSGPVTRAFKPQTDKLNAEVTTGYNHSDPGDRNAFGKRRLDASVNEGYIDGRANGEWNDLNWAFKAHISNLKDRLGINTNKYLASLQYGILGLRLGDSNPRLSEFTLWSRPMRGVELTMRTPGLNLDLEYGELQPEVKHKQYKRNILAVRPGFVLSDYTTWSLTFVKIKDDYISGWNAPTPNDNVVIGTDVDIHSLSRRVLIRTETAMSLYNSDISSGPLDQVKSFESFIVINKNFSPKITDEDVLSDTISSSDRMQKLLKALAKSAIAHRTSVTLNFFQNELKIGYKLIGKSFNSLGSGGLIADRKGFSVEDRIRLLDSRLYFTLGYDQFEDNINGVATRSDGTALVKKTSTFKTGVSYYSPPKYPNVNVSYRQVGNKNNGLASDRRYDDSRDEIRTSLDQTFEWMGRQNQAVISFGTSSMENRVLASASQLSDNSVSLALTSDRDPWKVQGGITTYGMDRPGTKVENSTVSGYLSATYTFIPNRFTATGSLSLFSNNGKTDIVSPDPGAPLAGATDLRPITVQKMETSSKSYSLDLASVYRITLNHEVSAGISQSWLKESSFTRFWDNSERYSPSFSGFRSQISYTYRI